MRSFGIWGGLWIQRLVFLWEKGKETGMWDDNTGEKALWRQKQRLEFWGHKPKATKARRIYKRHVRMIYESLRREYSPAQNWLKWSLCCNEFSCGEPGSLWVIFPGPQSPSDPDQGRVSHLPSLHGHRWTPGTWSQTCQPLWFMLSSPETAWLQEWAGPVVAVCVMECFCEADGASKWRRWVPAWGKDLAVFSASRKPECQSCRREGRFTGQACLDL